MHSYTELKHWSRYVCGGGACRRTDCDQTEGRASWELLDLLPEIDGTTAAIPAPSQFSTQDVSDLVGQSWCTRT